MASDKLSLDNYVIMRKVLADIAWYREKGCIDELSVQIMKNDSSKKIPLHYENKKFIESKVNADHKAGMSELVSSMSDLSDISEETLDSIKVWSDMCFYMRNPKSFDYLCSATFNDDITMTYGPLKFNLSQVSDEEMVRGDTVRRMLYYPKLPCGDDCEDVIFLTSAGQTIGTFYNAYKSGSLMDESDAILVYDLYVNQRDERAYMDGEADAPYRWESDRYKEYVGMSIDEDKLMRSVDGPITADSIPEDNCLAVHMSRLSYSTVSQPEDIRKKNEFLRNMFDVVMKTGELPAAIIPKNGGERETVRGFLNKYGPQELFPVLDAAYFMNSNKYERKMFCMQRNACDIIATKQEFQQFLNKDGEYISDDSYGVRDIDDSDIPPELDIPEK